jgi:hypothetical protein
MLPTCGCIRTTNSRTLVEQSIGRGLRLPYGKRTGVPDVDRLTIVSHDRFQEIVDHANDPNSIIRTGILIGRDIPDVPTKAVTIEPVFMTQLGLAIPPPAFGAGAEPQPAPTISEPERKTAEVTMQVIRQQFERLARSGDLKAPDVQQRITARGRHADGPSDPFLPLSGRGETAHKGNGVRRVREVPLKIGTSPLASNAEVCIDPDRLFGRHLAVLGNTGSGKSCSVAGLIRWSIEQAQAEGGGPPNARFIVLDPNGEYSRAFEDAERSTFVMGLARNSILIGRVLRIAVGLGYSLTLRPTA